MAEIDFTKLREKVGKRPYPIDFCEVLDVGTGALPREIEVRPPGRDGARLIALNNRYPGLEVGDTVRISISTVNGIAYVEDIGSDSAGGGIDTLQASKLVSPDQSIDPVLAADNSGDVTGENDLTLGDTARGNAFANWYDLNLINDDIPGSHYNDNDSSFPAEFSEIDAPQVTNTNDLYGFWYLQNNVGTGSWKYRFQTSVTPDSGSADLTIGPILFRDGQYSADVDYYFGLYRDNSGIDEGTFTRVHLQWDSATPQWRIRGEVDDGTTQTDSTWTVFSLPPTQPIWIRIRLVDVSTNVQTRSYFATAKQAKSHTLFQDINIPNASVTWGDVWIQYHQTRGAGVQDYLYLGGHDSESAA